MVRVVIIIYVTTITLFIFIIMDIIDALLQCKNITHLIAMHENNM